MLAVLNVSQFKTPCNNDIEWYVSKEFHEFFPWKMENLKRSSRFEFEIISLQFKTVEIKCCLDSDDTEF